ncbi:MAG: recombination-associated protein RdgC [Woeseiaceae bacterium]
MWFKNLRAFRLTYSIELTAEKLEEALSKHVFSPCGNIDLARMGWVPPLGNHGEMLTHTVGHYTMVCLRRQEKVMPPAAINERVNEKVAALETREGRPALRREKTSLKDEVTLELLPRALTKSDLVFAYFDLQRQYLLIDASSAGKAELLVEQLRAALDVLPVVPLDCHGDTADIMTRWLKSRVPDGFTLEQDIELQNTREARNVVRCRYQEIESQEVLAHLDAGKRVTKLAILWRESIRFMLAEDFGMTRMRFESKIMDHGDGEADDVVGTFDQDFAVMAVQLGRLLDELLDAFGGVEKI